MAALAKGRRIRMGVGTSVYQAHPMAEAARLIKAAGFSCVHLAWRFADVRFDPNQPDWSFGKRARDNGKRRVPPPPASKITFIRSIPLIFTNYTVLDFFTS